MSTAGKPSIQIIAIKEFRFRSQVILRKNFAVRFEQFNFDRLPRFPVALAAKLSEFCKSGFAPYKYPRWINFVTELPKTATGKIQRFLLRQKDGTAPAKF
jgi:acyl-coenzyme A synthetase/AMP-(fatty) acid ligase